MPYQQALQRTEAYISDDAYWDLDCPSMPGQFYNAQTLDYKDLLSQACLSAGATGCFLSDLEFSDESTYAPEVSDFIRSFVSQQNKEEHIWEYNIEEPLDIERRKVNKIKVRVHFKGRRPINFSL